MKALAETYRGVPDKIRSKTWTCHRNLQVFTETPTTYVSSGDQIIYGVDVSKDQREDNEIREGLELKAAGGPLPDFFDKLYVGGITKVESAVQNLPVSIHEFRSRASRWVNNEVALCPGDADQAAERARNEYRDEIALIRSELMANAAFALAASQSEKHCIEYLKVLR
jgi:hypothetical protein